LTGGPPVNPTLDQVQAIIDSRGPGGHDDDKSNLAFGI